MRSSFQPFAITEFKTGLFNYLQPWVRPVEAFDPLSNAFIDRGTLQKRRGYTEFGRLAYRNVGIQIAVGTGVASYNGVLSTFPIRAGTFTATNSVESFSDNGLGVLTGTVGGSGTINYTTGAWTLTFNSAVIAGVIIRGAYTYLPTQTTTPAASSRPIMGIKAWADDSNGTRKLLAMDTRRAAVYNEGTEQFDPISSVNQQIWQGNASTTTLPLTTGFTGIAPYSLSITDGTSTIRDNGTGGLSTSGNFAAGGTVNYSTGVITPVFTVAPAITISITASFSLQGDYFTGDNTKFFNAINWLGDMYMTNDIDRITLFDGTSLSRPAFPITQANKLTFTNNISTCLDIDVYKNRLLIQRPLLVGSATVAGQSIRWSAINNPTNLVADVTGNGGELSASTEDIIQSSEFLRDQLIVLFANSTWTFRFTGSAFDPFRFDKINNSKSTNAPYGTVDYDDKVTAMGSKGLIACDGVNVQRYDVSVIDQFLDINQSKFAQCFSQRFDTLNQTWMLYPSAQNDALISDKILVYNFLENTWATFELPLSCLGLYYVTKDAIWDSFIPGGANPINWNQAEFNWASYLLQDLAPTLLGGGHTGIVYQMNDNDSDEGEDIETSITSTRLNPFVGTGQKVEFGYVDFYYEKNNDCTLDLTFFVDNSSAPATTRTLTLDGPTNSDVHFKRIFINVSGQFLRFNIHNAQSEPFKILGMILWAAPSGRLTAGRSVS